MVSLSEKNGFGPPGGGVGRLLRLVRKELCEVLRDRRTIVTLVLMPLLLYPLLSIAFQQVATATLLDAARDPDQLPAPGKDSDEKDRLPDLRLGVGTKEEETLAYLIFGLAEDFHRQGKTTEAKEPRHPWRIVRVDNLLDALKERKVDLGLRLRGTPPRFRFDPFDKRGAWEKGDIDWEIVVLEGSVSSLQAEQLVERRLLWYHQRLARDRIQVNVRRDVITLPGGGAAVSLPALVPLVLILMTITGAVYPAIDSTAGERERGTLEMLVAAPVPRLGLLFAKYVTVVAVALLTGLVNLIGMVVTLKFSGLEREIIKGGLSVEVMFFTFALLVLFALFFSALLLSITSFARSFKEAQAYLIPLMLVSLGPGIIGILPGAKLEGIMVVAPLLNIVLLGRDLFEGHIDPAIAALVVTVTLLYAAAAIALAARVFGAESVLYSEQSGWSDLFRRPEEAQATASVSGALWCLALMIPIHYVVRGSIQLMSATGSATEGPAMDPMGALVAMACLNLVLFLGLPAVASWRGRVALRSGFALGWPGAAPIALGILLGVSVWPGMLWVLGQIYETIYLQLRQTFAGLGPRQQGVSDFLLVSVVLAGVVEELFFRGFLYSALERKCPGWLTVLMTALLFGLMHVLLGGLLGTFQFWPSTFMGLLLGSLRWASGSVWPGLLLHALHNGLLQSAPRMGLTNTAQIPDWCLAASGAGLAVGVVGIAYLIWRRAPLRTAAAALRTEA